MLKPLIRVSVLIFGNLFAFLIVGYILTMFFEIDRVVYQYLLLLSIFSLVYLLRREMKIYKQNLEKILTKSEKNNGK